MSDNMPDFDKMSQEEIMAWMETLAKRQGASEGFTTAADMDIAEVDPNTAIIDEPGYVPYGQEKTQPLQAAPPIPPPSIPEPVKPPAAQAPPAAPPRPVTPTPSTPPPSQQQTIRPPAAQTPPAAPPRPTTPPPSTPPPSQQQTIRPPAAQTPPAAPPRPVTPPPSAPPQQQTVRPPAAPPRPVTPPAAQVPTPPPPAPGAPPKSEHGSLAWLESLAADQDDDLFNLDLSGLPADVVEEAPAPPATNPMTWLEDLARSQVAEPSLERLGAGDDEEESEKLDPFAEGVNPMEWLETLAKRQGAKEEELTTGASLNVPATQEAEVEQDGYQPFSFDTPPTRRVSEPAALENPADFLTSLAGSEGYSEEGVRATQKPDTMSMESIQDAIANGTVSREQMQHFLEKQSDELAEQPEIPYVEDEESNEPIVQGELPDWLADLRPEPTTESTPEPTSSLDALFDTPATSEMPSWLTQDLIGADTYDLDSIFAPEDEEESRPLEPVAQDASLAYEIEVDPSDPWVEAFDEEYAQGGAADIQVVPDWYKQNTSDPARIAAVESQTNFDESDEALEDAALPVENSLSLGQAQAVPEWAGGSTAQVEVEDQPAGYGSVFDNEMPDWLKEVEQSVTPEDVPDWLVETISTQEETLPRPIQYSEPMPQVIIEPPQPVAPPPAAKPVTPKPVETLIGDVAAVIERARDREQSGDLEGALAEYEAMIRTNSALDAVVNELSQLVKSYKTTPAVYRVLGDGLMRQGKLQAALNTYREALNQL